MKINKGDYVLTPRFCHVTIDEVYNTKHEARENGYTEPTYYDGEYDIFGKSLGDCRMAFAAVKKG